MYKRLTIISVVILVALVGLSVLGYHSIQLQAEGLTGKREGEFVAVAEQIRTDVKRKLDEFIRTEHNRPYTDYQYYYVPEASNEQVALVRSPLGDKLEHSLAYGHFQIEPNGAVVTPFYSPAQSQVGRAKAQIYISNLEKHLLPALAGNGQGIGTWRLKERAAGTVTVAQKVDEDFKDSATAGDLTSTSSVAVRRSISEEKAQAQKLLSAKLGKGKSASRRRGQYQIQSLQKARQEPVVVTQMRGNVELNLDNRAIAQQQERAQRVSGLGLPGQTAGEAQVEATLQDAVAPTSQQVEELDREASEAMNAARPMDRSDVDAVSAGARGLQSVQEDQQELAKPADGLTAGFREGQRGEQRQQAQLQSEVQQAETVQIRIEPFAPLIVSKAAVDEAIFDGEVFLLRHVQIEDKHFLQGFQLNDEKLIEEVEESARRFMREGMDFDVGRAEQRDAAYAAILDFGFADLVLNLIELEPGWIGKQVSQLRYWYYGIIMIVFFAVLLGLAGLWRNVRAQLKVAEKKDDFISAVSHELRTPLTTIRMYTEMLEKDWIKTEDKRGEYYRNMRQESERLSRLVENVLDFSRIKKGRKKYNFQVGNLNNCVAEVVEMMTPYAEQNGFVIRKDFGQEGEIAFDGDAVMQIVVNLMDNAVKYGRGAVDKTITIRTRDKGQFVLVEVEDHGPGVPHRLRKKVFDEFYRCGSESTRETAGAGLGLALVKRFAQAHNGFVEIFTAKPSGAIFRVALSVQS